MTCCCIISPAIQKAILKNGTPAQRILALTALEHGARLRGYREAVASLRGVIGMAPGGKAWRTYDERNRPWLPGWPVRREADAPVADPVVNQAHEGASTTYDFYKTLFNRNSIDNRGMEIFSTVHYRKRYDNAFWNGRQMVYGDGDGDIFGAFTGVIDVIGHELTHGVTQYTANLNYEGQSGGLNEAISDIFGIQVKQWKEQTKAADADWIIGKGIFMPGIQGVGLRSMKAPGTAYDDPTIGKDAQIAHMRDYTDELDVHNSSGIANKAFYLLAVALGGYSWESGAGHIVYDALLQAQPDTDFAGFAALMVSVATTRYPQAVQAVKDAWAQVGISA